MPTIPFNMPFLGLPLPPSHIPLLLHLLIETAASLSFLLRPESQLPLLSSTTSPTTTTSPSTTTASKTTSPTDPTTTTKITPKQATEAHLILSNFGGLLLSINLAVAYLLFLFTGPGKEEVIRGVTGCLSVYHAFPVWRAWRRMNLAKESAGAQRREGKVEGEGNVDETQKTLGGPVVHFAVHSLVGGLMGAVGLGFL